MTKSKAKAVVKKPGLQERPLSPHISIYRPQITSVLSIMHRITGAACFMILMVTIWWIFIEVLGPTNEPTIVKLYNSAFGTFAIVTLVFCFYFHLFNGIRHLMWDMGKGFNIVVVNTTGWLVIIASVLITVAHWWFFKIGIRG
jgi:succinate dehydrogenase / fumarate reductase cytochrome b subunit